MAPFPMLTVLISCNQKVVHMTSDNSYQTLSSWFNKCPHTHGSESHLAPPSFSNTMLTCACHSSGAAVKPYTDFSKRTTLSPTGSPMASASSCGAKAYFDFSSFRPFQHAAVTSPFVSSHFLCTTTWSRSCLLLLLSVGLHVFSCPRNGS